MQAPTPSRCLQKSVSLCLIQTYKINLLAAAGRCSASSPASSIASPASVTAFFSLRRLPVIGSSISHSGPVYDLTLDRMECSIWPILSGPASRTARKQKGKSNTLKPKYTPTATQPYSLLNFLNLALMPVGSGLPRCGVGSGRGAFFEELKRRKLRKGRKRRLRYEVCHD